MGKPTTSAELLLHPLRLRIVQAFLGNRELTTADVQAEVADASPATLYRHIGLLADAGVLEVAAERRARGSVERTYRLRVERASVDPGDLRSMTAEDHRAAFMAFLAAVLADFDAYVARGADFVRDRAGYRTAAYYATDEEADAVGAALRRALAPLLDNPPGPDRTRRSLTTIALTNRNVL